MHIQFLGTGGAFDFEKGNASAIVEVSGKKILIDCGFSTIVKLAALNLFEEIDYIVITHLHADHVGSLATLLAYYKYKSSHPTPKIVVPIDSFAQEIRNLLDCSLESDLAHFVPISEVECIGYLDTTDQHKEGMASFAYYFKENDYLIYYSGDIGNADTAKAFLDTRIESHIQVFHETSPRDDIVSHTSYIEVQNTLSKYDPYVYHIAKDDMPEDCTLKLVEDYPEFLY